ncbi:MAG: Uma2 family endonuclease [Polyangiaceae bacterium]
MAEPAQKGPTLADIDALPPGQKGEIIDGVLYTMTRPRFRHQRMVATLDRKIGPPFDDGDGGPGGWWILPEPGIEVPDSPEFSPDLAGWKRERLAIPPTDKTIDVVPDWICELLSPTTRRHDMVVKKPFYARIGVPYLWLVDLDAEAIVVLQLSEGKWIELSTFSDEADARMPPFDQVSFDVKSWWAKVQLTER